MLLTALALYASIQAGPPAQSAPTGVRDTTHADSARRSKPKPLPVTAAVVASAFHDAPARELFNRARRAHAAQDSSIVSYDAKVKQRLSVFASLGHFGPDRLVYRSESAARVRWQRGTGARIEMTGNRVSAPPLGSEKIEREAVRDMVTDDKMSPIPYFPGSESLWIGGLSAQTEIDPGSMVNPLAEGAEAYYTYRTGQSLEFRLPGGTVVQLRELDVRPRSAKFNLAVGSLWFDVSSGQLVRAAYRLAAEAKAGVNISVSNGNPNAKAPKIFSAIVSGLMPSGRAQISAIAVEYGLYEGRFWLPRAQIAEGMVEMSFARVPVKFENSFDYASVNGTLDLGRINVDTTSVDERPPRLGRPPAGLDAPVRKAWQDSARLVYDAAMKARRDSTAAGLKRGSLAQCDSASTRVVTQQRDDARLPVEVRIPCNLDLLIHSPDLPKSAYDPGEDVFGSAQAQQMIADALTMAAQSPLALGMLPRPRIVYGLSMTRYNRVEGLSTGALVEESPGGGYSVSALGRYGFGDHIGNGELSLARTNLSKTIKLTGYKRLVSASDWGDPLSFRSSVAARLFGRDEGFYFRATGAELAWTSDRGTRLEWRAFTERESSALQTRAKSFGSTFISNIAADPGQFTGLGVRFLHTYGLDPRGFRVFADLRLEGARGDSVYGRAALDLTLSKQLPAAIAGSLTLAGGSSVGALPSQRRWFLGGTSTIRGLAPDTAQSGNAFWMSRAELARGPAAFRTSIFGDIGWTGDRTKMSAVGRPLSSVGVGFSGLDDLIRLEVARGLFPHEQTRLLFYLNPRF
jgi:hypothetical protein